VDQGKTVAVAVLAAAVAAGLLRLATTRIDRGLSERKRFRMSRRAARLTAASVALAAVIVAVAVGAPGWVQREYDVFIKGAPVQTTDLRSRLTDPSSNGRTEHWRTAIHGFSDAVLRGHGAGTYQFLWEKNRKEGTAVTDAHSLYAEVLAELGLPGLLLLASTLLLILFALWRRTRGRGPNQLAYAALFAATVAWLVHAGIDWDWEMPAVTAWVFAVGGAALAGRAAGEPEKPMGNRGRIPLAACLLVVAIAPALVMLSQFHLEASADAFEAGDCKAADRNAFSSIGVLAIRPEPYQIIGYCDLDNGLLTEAVDAMTKAVAQEPRRWEYHLSLAIAQAAAGADPQAQIAEAYRLSPKEPLVLQAVKQFRGKPASSWPKRAEAFSATVESSGQLTLR
jgi:hypothetical protein